MENDWTRRTFLKTATTGAMAGWVLSHNRALGANDRLGIGVIGCGGRT